MNFLLLLVLVFAVALAAPVYPEISTTSFQQRNLARDVEDRNNPAFISQIATAAFQVNLILLVVKWRIIFCVIDPTTCGSSVINPANVHMYEALETPNTLTATDVINTLEDISTFNFIDLVSTQMNSTSSIHEQAVQQKHLIFPSLKIINQVEQSQKTGKHQAELKTETVETQNPTLSVTSRPSYITYVPHSEFQWPMYRDLYFYSSPSVSFRLI